MRRCARALRRLVLGTALLAFLACGFLPAPPVKAEGESWIERNFVTAPAPDLLTSERGRIQWVDLWGDRRLRVPLGAGALAVGADGSWIVSGSPYSGVMKIWDRKTGREIRTLHGRKARSLNGSELVALVACEDGARIIAAYRAGFEIWDVKTGKKIRGFDPPPDPVTNTLAAVRADGAWIAFTQAGDDAWSTIITVWDTMTGARLHRLSVEEGMVRSLVLSQDGRWVVAGTDNPRGYGTIRVWSTETGTQVRTLGDEAARHLAIRADGKRLVSLSRSASICVWDLATGAQLRSIERTYAPELMGLVLSPDGTWFVTISTEGRLSFWETETGRPLRHASGVTSPTMAGAIDPPGKLLVTAHLDGGLRLWDVATGRLESVAPPPPDGMLSMARASRGGLIAAGSIQGSVQLWDGGMAPRRTLYGHSSLVQGVAIAADGTWVVSGAFDGLKVFDTATGALRWTASAKRIPSEQISKLVDLLGDYDTDLVYSRHRNCVHDVTIDPSGQWVLSGHLDGVVMIRDATTGDHVRTLGKPAEMIKTQVVVSPDQRWIVGGSGQDEFPKLRIWDAGTGELRHEIAGHLGAIHEIAFGPSGDWFASASADGTVRLWDAKTGKVRQRLCGHKDAVTGLAISEDGTWLATASFDRLVVWDAAAGRMIDRIRTDGGAPRGLAVEGTTIWAGFHSGWFQVYEYAPRTPRAP